MTPTVTISRENPGVVLKPNDTETITFTFTEAPQGFTLDDLF
jgi:hypothetical protein